METENAAAETSPSELTIHLKSPVPHEGKTYTKLTFREAEMSDLIAVEEMPGGGQSDMRDMARLMSVVTGVPFEAVLKIKARDLGEITKRAGALLGNDVGGDGETSPS